MRVRAVLLAAAFALAPLGVEAADLVVWWEEGYYTGEDQAVRELVAAFERKTGKQVGLAFYPLDALPGRTAAAVAAGNPPDFVFNQQTNAYHARWAHEGRLVDLTDALGPFATQFDRDALDRATLPDATGRRGLYALPMGYDTNHVHVWKSLLEKAGLTLADIPKEWEPFWSFWCDKVQPALRKATGRDDVWGVGEPMSTSGNDTEIGFRQFVEAYEADYVTRDGRLVIDEPEVRARLVEALDRYTSLYKEGCVPPDALDWDSRGNNQAFLAQSVVMTTNTTLSIPNALKAARPEDYYENTVTIGWPSSADRGLLTVYAGLQEAVAFSAGGHEALTREFVRFLVGGGWLGHWLDFTGDRYLPPMPALIDQPFWLDPSDPHHMASAIQFLTRPRTYDYVAASGEWRHARVRTERVWSIAVHRVVVDGLSPERAVDEAVARVHQLLSE